MAFGAKSIRPIDTRPGTAVGLNIPFTGPTGFSSTYTTRDATKNNLINYFLTNVGDRYDNPTFGANLRQYIFEQIEQSTFDSVTEDIQAKIATYFPSVQVQEVSINQVDENTDANIILVTIKYSIVNTGTSDTLQIAFG